MFESIPRLPDWVLIALMLLAIIGACSVIGFGARFVFHHLTWIA